MHTSHIQSSSRPSSNWLAVVHQYFPTFVNKLLEHLNLSLAATVLAIVIAIPLGIYLTRAPKIRSTIFSITNIFQTIPSLALLAFLIPIFGIGIKPTIITLVIYALLPITRNTYTGVININPDIIEAAQGLGFTPWQRLRKIELPLALPFVIAGIRTATAMTIGITTIAAFVGAGGLGDFITQGLALNDNKLILLGAIPAALLALTLDYIIAELENLLQPRRRHAMAYKGLKIFMMVLLCSLIISALVYRSIDHFFNEKRRNTIIVASKNFTEQYILANIIAELIANRTHLTVEKKLNLGATNVAQQALLKGDIDIYPEYTGTAYLTILKHKKILKPAEIYAIVKREYRQRYRLIWLAPFGFNNSQTLATKTAFAKQHQLHTLSDLAQISTAITLGAPPEFIKRPDGLLGLKTVYQFKFRRVIQMQPDLMYEAIQRGAVDVIEVFTTDARNKSYHLRQLIDNKHFYPPYYAAPIVREAVLIAHPQLKRVLGLLAGKIDNKTMERLNAEVEIQKKSPASVAREFLTKKHLLHGR